MKTKFPRALVTIFMTVSFVVFAFGQASSVNPNDPDPVRVIGWIGIIIAALTHTAMNVYNMIRGKNYEQLRESVANYKELAESRLATIGQLRADIASVQADMRRLEFENERLAEQVLRK